ncbi:MAG: PEGA domain-containing protein [Suilimivivens sp.]
MRKNLKKENMIKCFVVGLCMLLTGCGTIGLAREATFESAYENVQEEETVPVFTSECCGVLETVDAQAGTITFYQIDAGEEMTLFFDGATMVQDRFGSSLVMTQLIPGEIITVQYNSELQKAGNVAASSDAWSYDDIAKFEIDEGRGTLQTGNETYRISADTKVFSGSEQLAMNQILSQDVISLKGIGHDVVSIVIHKGHGYLNLENEEAMAGGWIEVGQTVIQQIAKDMLIIVPEGNYAVRLTKDGIDETREVTIERDKETVLDLGDIEVPQPVNGRVVFSIYPAEASVSVDGTPVNTSYAVLLPFGLHQITVSAEGYDTISEYFNVEGETTTVKLALNLSEGDSTVSGNSVTEENSGHTITVNAPENVEVYQDNLYIGISPVTYGKTAGSHTISLRKSGYVTQSYQIEVEDDDRDLVYSFPDLIAETTTGNDSYSSTVSGNTVSGNNAVISNSDNQNSDTVSGNGMTVSGNN